jgi:hypothetical protein
VQRLDLQTQHVDLPLLTRQRIVEFGDRLFLERKLRL